MTPILYRAPAKLNLTLEILGRRSDGYHEVSSVMTTLDFHDTLAVESGRGVVVSADESYDASALPTQPGELNTIETALALVTAKRIEAQSGQRVGAVAALQDGLQQVGLRLHKEIPAAAGLGGGSSDGVAALLALNRYWNLGLTEADLLTLALAIGSDCPFFLQGGVQLAGGRGEELQPLPAPAPFWICLLKPPIARRSKTAYLYSLLRGSHFSDGSRSVALAQRLREQPGVPLSPGDLFNAFDAVSDEAYGSLAPHRRELEERGARGVHLCGSGPTLYGLFTDERTANAAAEALRSDHLEVWAVRGPAPPRVDFVSPL